MIMENNGIPDVDWDEAEDAFRLFAFHTYYNRSFNTEKDPTVRFAKALVASAHPIDDEQAVLDWYKTVGSVEITGQAKAHALGTVTHDVGARKAAIAC